MPLDLPDASSSPAPVAPTVSISGGVNQKRVQNAKKDAVDDATGWVGSQDPLWNPAIDGDEGYTVKVNLPASLLDEVGLYTFRLEVTSASAGTFHQVWDIRVSG